MPNIRRKKRGGEETILVTGQQDTIDVTMAGTIFRDNPLPE
jgi:hypothetical protein